MTHNYESSTDGNKRFMCNNILQSTVFHFCELKMCRFYEQMGKKNVDCYFTANRFKYFVN